MSKISCDVIKDLLPLYIDEVVSEDSKIIVEEHIASCEGCRELMQQMAEDVVVPVSREAAQQEFMFLTKVQSMIERKNVRTGMIAALSSAIVVIGVYCLMCLPTKVIPYEEGLINITEQGDKVYAQFAGENYNCVYMLSEAVAVENDGTEEIIVAMYYDQSIYSKFIEPRIKKDKKFENPCLNGGYGTTIDGKEVHVNEELQAVYYSPEKIDNRAMTENGESWTDNLDEMQLIWEK